MIESIIDLPMVLFYPDRWSRAGYGIIDNDRYCLTFSRDYSRAGMIKVKVTERGSDLSECFWITDLVLMK